MPTNTLYEVPVMVLTEQSFRSQNPHNQNHDNSIGLSLDYMIMSGYGFVGWIYPLRVLEGPIL